MIEPKHNVSKERATDILKDGQPLVSLYIAEKLELSGLDNWREEIVIENCIIEAFSCIMIQFEKPVRLINSHLKKCEFTFSYFLGGLTIDNCTFDSYLDFQAGGHNKTGHSIIVTNNEFKGFVNFFDCWYENEVKISHNRFLKGTNLLGKPHNIPVTFDIEPLIKDNVGQLGLSNEGE